MRALLFICLIALVELGCVTQGSDFPSEHDWISKNITRQEDVALILGKPHAVGNSGGTETWTYGFYKYKLFAKDHYNYKEIKFYWNSNNTVRHYNFSSTFSKDVNQKKLAKINQSQKMSAPENRDQENMEMVPAGTSGN